MRLAGRRRTRPATPGTYLFLPPGVPHNIANASDKPARVSMTVSPPGHEHYFEELAETVARGGAADPTDRELARALRHGSALCAQN